jgi:uncharacterized protein DUF6496
MAMRKSSSKTTRSSKKTARKAGARTKTGARTATKRGSSRRYGQKAESKVERSMHEMKRGQLRSGRSGKKVTSRKQAIAIGLSEARREGGKVPPPRKSR